MKDLGKILKQAKEMQDKIAVMNAKLAERTVEASSGGGMVTVTMNGRHEVVSIKIDPEVVNKDDVEMLEDLVLAAVNEARGKVEEMVKEEMNNLAGGLPLQGLF
ncbi:MAG: YbaB/EbfC family nucleoid-associated protein [Candidatus Latescibacteria bacterium 4484_7]|nr:MAG: YbaB/EbfC family nucleoid-associated protein [Candidatus Latescibacteria bacterium 4484_7]